MVPKFTNYTAEKTLDAVEHLAKLIKECHSEYSCIIAPVRGGLVPGVMLSHALGIPLFPIAYSLRDHKSQIGASAELIDFVNQYPNKNVVLIDDIVDSGKTIKLILQHTAEVLPNTAVDIATLINNVESKVPVRFSHQDFKRSCCSDWILFHWELKNK